MKNFKLTLNIFTFICLTTGIGAQAQSVYEFSVSTNPYENLTDPISLNNNMVWDDPEFEIPLGFNFQLGPHIFNTLYIVEWGLGALLSNTTDEDGIGSIIFPVGQDIIDLGDGSGISESPISYKIEGAPGSQIAKIEWNNVGFFDDLTSSDFMNFQLWLYEGSNKIEYHYGPSQINNPSQSYEGQTGPIVGLFPSINLGSDILLDNAYFLSENPSNPQLITIEAGEQLDEPFALQGTIPDGTVYSFDPTNLSLSNFEKFEFALFPNPTKDFFQIQTQAENFQIEFYNSLGQKLKLSQNSRGLFDLSNLPIGIYLVKIKTSFGIQTKQIIKI